MFEFYPDRPSPSTHFADPRGRSIAVEADGPGDYAEEPCDPNGSSIRNSAPPHRLVPTVSEPPCSVTTRWLKLSPIPYPAFRVVKNGSKIFPRMRAAPPAGIGHPEDDPPVLRGGEDRKTPRPHEGFHGLDGIGDQVEHDLLDQAGIRGTPRQVRRQLLGQGDSVFSKNGQGDPNGLRGEVVHVDGYEAARVGLEKSITLWMTNAILVDAALVFSMIS